MTDIVKGVIDGGWTLLVGWILPSALNVLFFSLIVYPSVKDSAPFSSIPSNTASLIVAAVVVGIISSALQTPMYRILEGYVGWPSWLFRQGQARHIKRRVRLKHRLNYAGHMKAKKDLNSANERWEAAAKSGDALALEKAKADQQTATASLRTWENAGIEAAAWLANRDNIRSWIWHRRRPTAGERGQGGRWPSRPRRATPLDRAEALTHLQRQILAERLARYPVDEEQILPTLLGNSIRRFERFGPAHYELDQQRLWYELIAVAPERVGKQVDQMRTGVDFFVSLLFGQAVIGASALALAIFDPNRILWLGLGALVSIVLAGLAYRGAVLSTDEWAFAVQALLNVGRKPLAQALFLRLPDTLEAERQMWRTLGQFLRAKPSPAAMAGLDKYRDQSRPPEEADEEPPN